LKTLFLLRHADADWGPKGSKDFDRVLSPVGQEQCTLVANYLKQQDCMPDIVISSNAVRAFETAERVKIALNTNWDIKKNAELYLSNTTQLIEEIQLISDNYNHAMIIGHNPTLHETSWLLSSKSDSGLMTEIEKGFPPATLTTHSFTTNQWADVDKGKGVLQGIFKV